MRTRIVLAVTVLALLLLGGSHLRLTAAPAPPADACSLLTTAEVSAALEVTSLAGTHPFGSPKACMWSDVQKPGLSNRRVTLSIATSTAGFDMMKAKRALPIEPAPGIGDEAFYQTMGTSQEAPMLRVKKGTGAFDLRILNGLKFKPFTVDQAKAKEATLAKAAAGRF